jgi:hypothetical protein
MAHFMQSKIIHQIYGSVDNETKNVTAGDFLGCSSAMMLFSMPAIDLAPTVLKVQGSNTTVSTGFSDLTNGSFSVFPGTTADGSVWRVDIPNLKYRWLRWTITIGDGTTNTYISTAIGFTKVDGPTSDLDAGVEKAGAYLVAY